MIATILFFWSHLFVFAHAVLLQAVQGVQAAGPVVAAHPSGTVLGTEVTVAALFVQIIEWAKEKAWLPFVTKHAGAINKVVAGLTALVSAFGISHTWDASTRSFTIGNLPTLAMGLVVAWTFVKQYMFQWMIYHGIAKNISKTV